MSCFASNLSLMIVNNYFQMISFKKLYCIQDYAYSHAISPIHVSAFLLEWREMGNYSLQAEGVGLGTCNVQCVRTALAA